ncbi:hypothetical protein QP992_03620 [Corynebacterium ulcerans]|uniref:hypothetical protein n=1 Tax=Corynebacterium ulcerans TaxID=65058 RepID=UPI0018DA0375|nr:hypothetical protein [Corynebacterium ulcerans]MBH5296527.1 hypothetical protein [Corynebacterium ulcerans]MDK8888228.1 hypothetical protein [Corynebacterium ulcerans]
MTNPQRRYSNGLTAEQQRLSDRKYRHSQRKVRTWVDEVAQRVGMTRLELIQRIDPDALGPLIVSTLKGA